jgi:hypothetical protein
MMINAIHIKLPLFLIAVSLFMPAVLVKGEEKCWADDQYYMDVDGYNDHWKTFKLALAQDLAEANDNSTGPFTLYFDLPTYAPGLVAVKEEGCESYGSMMTTLNFTFNADDVCTPDASYSDPEDRIFLNVTNSSMVFTNFPICLENNCADMEEEKALNAASSAVGYGFSFCQMDSVSISIPETDSSGSNSTNSTGKGGKAAVFQC